MSTERKTIDQITRTLTSFSGTEYIPGRDTTGDFKATVAALVNYAVAGGLVKEIDDSDYTIQDTDVYTRYIFKNLTADRTLTFPTLADNQGYEFNVINADGSYNINCTPEGSDDINDWNVAFPITEKGGEIKFLATATKWAATPLNDACIYEVSTETEDTGLALDGTWDDVSVDGGTNPMTLLSGVYGKGILEAYGNQVGGDSSVAAYIDLFFGIGKTSGSNPPDIDGAYDNENYVQTPVNQMRYLALTRRIKCEYESDGSTVYMKSKVLSDELNTTEHIMRGTTNNPMYIRFCRRY
jgi:hypothetical protein